MDLIDSNVETSESVDRVEQLMAIPDMTSKEYTDVLKTMSFLDTFKYLFQRKVDQNDQKYRNQFTKEGETGWDRMKLMWSEYYDGEDNPEMRFIASSVGWGCLAGGFYGGVICNRSSVEDFMRRHNEYVFRGDFEAKRRIRDTMFLQFGRFGLRWAWRMGLFTGVLSALTTSAIAYRNDVYFSDCAIAGGLVCGLWKVKLGLRAMAVSGVVGSILGLMFAGSVKLMLWTLNTSVPEYRHWRHSRYMGHLTVEKYSDGSTEFDWDIERKRQLKTQYKSQSHSQDST